MKKVAIIILCGAISFAVGYGLAAKKHAKMANENAVIYTEDDEARYFLPSTASIIDV